MKGDLSGNWFFKNKKKSSDTIDLMKKKKIEKIKSNRFFSPSSEGCAQMRNRLLRIK
jgi:hypothetical protein